MRASDSVLIFHLCLICYQWIGDIFNTQILFHNLNYIFFNSLSGRELFERITAEGYSMSEAEVINYMRQICEGVKHMHEKNIIHLGR